MSASFQSRNSRVRPGPLALAGLAASVLFATAAGASAAGLTSDEIRRKPVTYHAGSNCYGNQHTCNISFGSTPNNKNKRLEIAGVSCQARIYSGVVYRISLEGGTTLEAYDHLHPVHTGTHNDNEYYLGRSEMRYFAPVGDEMKAYVNATGDITQFFCTLQGTTVTYE